MLHILDSDTRKLGKIAYPGDSRHAYDVHILVLHTLMHVDVFSSDLLEQIKGPN